MDARRQLRVLDALILLVTVSGPVSSFYSAILAGFSLAGNLLFAVVAMSHGLAVVVLLWRRTLVFRETF